MRSKSSYGRHEPDEFGFAVSEFDSSRGNDANANSAEEVLGEIGLVLVVILGAIVAVNMLSSP